jgi:hypothetical protein
MQPAAEQLSLPGLVKTWPGSRIDIERRTVRTA